MGKWKRQMCCYWQESPWWDGGIEEGYDIINIMLEAYMWPIICAMLLVNVHDDLGDSLRLAECHDLEILGEEFKSEMKASVEV
jgi:hypothetical protein